MRELRNAARLAALVAALVAGMWWAPPSSAQVAPLGPTRPVLAAQGPPAGGAPASAASPASPRSPAPHAAPISPSAGASASAGTANVAGTPVPDASQRAFASARERLLQVRTLLRGQDSQASVGSGFLVTAEGHLITNYHVVSQYALKPTQYRLVYATADGKQGALQLLDIDVVHDLALLKVV